MQYFNINSNTNECFALFHGTGGNEYSLLQIAGDIEPDAQIISFIGDVGEREGRRFFAPLVNGALDREDFNARVASFLQQWDALAITKDVTMIGFSNGANFLLGVLEQRPTIAKRIVLLHPSNLQYAFTGTFETAVYITAGALDTIAIAGDTMKLAKQLAQHFDTTIKLFDGAHHVSDEEITYLQRTLR